MYYTWRTGRINAKVVWWGPKGVGTTSTLHALSDAVSHKVEAGEAEPPGDQKAVGMRRNHQPVEIDEEDRKLTAYFFHPPGRLGEFEGHELHYKCVTPEGEPEQNRAYAGVFDGVTAVVLTLDARRERQEANRDAIERLAGHLSRRFEVSAPTSAGVLEEVMGVSESGDGVAMIVQLNRYCAESALGAAEIARNLQLPEIATVESNSSDDSEAVWQVVSVIREELETHLRAGVARGRIPERAE